MKLRLTPAQYATIESKINLQGTEDYAVVVQKRNGRIIYGVHVFERQPSTKELVTYEETASRVQYKGTTAEVKGSALLAGVNLYKLLVARAYDIQVGRTLHETLTREQARELVPDLQKRETIREFLGNVSGLTASTSDEEEVADGGVSEDAAE